MLLVRLCVVFSCVLLVAPFAPAQRRPAGDGTPQITKLTPEFLEVGQDPAEVRVEGRDFARDATVRIRVLNDQGGGADYPATVDGPTVMRVRVPADFLENPGRIEVRVKNPNGEVSAWAQLEVRTRRGGGVSVGGPVITRISPTEVEARSRDVYVTIYGRGLVEGADVEFRVGNATASAQGRLTGRDLVVKLPPEILSRPQSVSLRVKGGTGVWSDPMRFEVVSQGRPSGGGGSGDPFISRIDPPRIDIRGARSQTVELIGQNVDRQGARVLLRVEGSGESGTAVPVTARTSASNGTVLAVELTPNMIRQSGIYELRIVNPNGRLSNWVRLEVINADGGAGPTDAVVDVAIPRSVTITAVTTTIPVDLRVRNNGRRPVRLDDFALLGRDRTRFAAPGSLEVPPGGERRLRVEVPVPLTLGVGQRRAASYDVVFVYSISGPGGSKSEQRFPLTGATTVSVRNEIALVDIGREYVRDPQVGNTEGWRFFKSANPANEGAGRLAEFYLFADAITTGNRRTATELVNYRPDPNDPRERGVFYLILDPDEVRRLDERGRARGTRLGYAAAESAPGLVPLYRWVRREGPRQINNYLSTSDRLESLPRNLQQQPGWRLDRVVGYVVPRT